MSINITIKHIKLSIGFHLLHLSTYKVNDIVDLRVYEDKPDKAIINSKNNLIAPLILGVSFIILGVVLLIIFVLF